MGSRPKIINFNDESVRRLLDDDDISSLSEIGDNDEGETYNHFYPSDSDDQSGKYYIIIVVQLLVNVNN